MGPWSSLYCFSHLRLNFLLRIGFLYMIWLYQMGSWSSLYCFIYVRLNLLLRIGFPYMICKWIIWFPTLVLRDKELKHGSLLPGHDCSCCIRSMGNLISSSWDGMGYPNGAFFWKKSFTWIDLWPGSSRFCLKVRSWFKLGQPQSKIQQV